MQLVLHKEISEWFPNRKPLFDDFMSVKGEVFRSTNNRETLRVVKGNKSYFIKKHFGVGCKEFLKNVLQFRLPVFSAKNEWLAIQKLEQLGIPTMTLVGYGWCGINPIKRQSFVITEEIQNILGLRDICISWHKNPLTFAIKKAIIEELAYIAKTMHENGINHRDFYSAHFLLDKPSVMNLNKPKLYLIDLHRAQIREKIPERWLIKDIAALYFSVLNTKLTQRDIFRFLSGYFAKPWCEVIKQYGTFLYKIEKRAKKLYKKISCDSSRFAVEKNWRDQPEIRQLFLELFDKMLNL